MASTDVPERTPRPRSPRATAALANHHRAHARRPRRGPRAPRRRSPATSAGRRSTRRPSRARPSDLIADPVVRNQIAATLVDRLYTNVDVAAALEQRLPADQKGLAAPARRRLAGRRRPPGAGAARAPARPGGVRGRADREPGRAHPPPRRQVEGGQEDGGNVVHRPPAADRSSSATASRSSATSRRSCRRTPARS